MDQEVFVPGELVGQENMFAAELWLAGSLLGTGEVFGRAGTHCCCEPAQTVPPQIPSTAPLFPPGLPEAVWL